MVSTQYLRGRGDVLAGRPKNLGGGNENLSPPLTTSTLETRPLSSFPNHPSVGPIAP